MPLLFQRFRCVSEVRHVNKIRPTNSSHLRVVLANSSNGFDFVFYLFYHWNCCEYLCIECGLSKYEIHLKTQVNRCCFDWIEKRMIFVFVVESLKIVKKRLFVKWVNCFRMTNLRIDENETKSKWWTHGRISHCSFVLFFFS